ncbi:MAG: glycoside hydrolase family 13 protein [Eubacteriales bacterium SKADARSKE-1]|nr:glycoside hydrolase family 13 protein [Eubacteriales bacterium SKADARSKE-1]
MYHIFNSLDSNYKKPIGAISENTSVHFKIFLKKTLKCNEATLILKDDNTGENLKYSMFWCGDLEDNYELWECDFVPSHIGLFWYYFEINTDSGPKNIVKTELGLGKLTPPSKTPTTWQITIYSKDFKTPDWLSGGIMYQIFPDRFFNSGKIKENVPNDRTIRTDWYGEPLYQPDKYGKITNSDYFGGDLAGIVEKLPYLKTLGVSCIYLNPIFLAHSNHRYNTADYAQIDPLLGTEQDLKTLCASAKKLGISIILDGVFSHTGSDSIYFNRENRYNSIGAYNDKNSPYFSWYQFSNWPKEYKSWWGITTLPEVDETDPDYCEFITGNEGILKKWLKTGIRGWRLDVADELPDSFIKKIRMSIKEEDHDAILLGEVWEDASNKESYHIRRQYLLGNELDSVMNYPFRDSIINFITTGNARSFLNIVGSVLENYPSCVIRNLMNMLGTHDTDRIFTIISNGCDKININSEKHYQNLLRVAIAIQYTLPGVPCIYYGDEAGLEGGRDPFCRRCYPWGHENTELIEFYRQIGNIRLSSPSLKSGDFTPILENLGTLAYIRKSKNDALICIFNLNQKSLEVPLQSGFTNFKWLLGNGYLDSNKAIIFSESFSLIRCENLSALK